MKLLILALAGGLGTLTRYGTSVLVSHWIKESSFPWAIFSVNMLGCLLFGLVFSYTETKTEWPVEFRLYVLVGFMGAFTTYSTFAFESAVFIKESQWGMALANILSQNILGVLCVFAGLYLGKMLS
jgi:CrcB protein